MFEFLINAYSKVLVDFFYYVTSITDNGTLVFAYIMRYFFIQEY